MNDARHFLSTRPLMASLVVLVGLVLLVQLTSGEAGAAKGKAKVAVSVVTKKQSSLLKKGKLKVKLDANRKRKVKLSAAHDGQGKFFEKDKIKLRKKARNVSLKLTKKGQEEARELRRQAGPRVRQVQVEGEKAHEERLARAQAGQGAMRCALPTSTGRERRSLRLPRPGGLPAAVPE